jgi:hypothetical protein
MDAWNARSLADEPVVRLIFDGSDHKATAISPPVVLGNPTAPVRNHFRGAKSRRQRPASGRTVAR